MKIKKTRWTLFKTLNLFGFLIVHKDVELDEQAIRHERIHTEQMKELWYVFFYLYYVFEWLLWGFKSQKISFELEANEHDWDWDYLEPDNQWSRKPYAWREYLWRP